VTRVIGQISRPRCSHFRLRRDGTARFAEASYWLRSCRNPPSPGCGVARHSSRLSPATSSPGSDSSRRRLSSSPSSSPSRRGLLAPGSAQLDTLAVYFAPRVTSYPWPNSRNSHPIPPVPSGTRARPAPTKASACNSLLNSGYGATICTNC